METGGRFWVKCVARACLISPCVLLSASLIPGVAHSFSIERISVDSLGQQAESGDVYAGITPDGRYISYGSSASNLVPDDTNGVSDVFVYDAENGTIERVSVDSQGREANGASLNSAISADGRFVAFASEASNLVPNDTNSSYDVFVRDRLTGSTERVSVDSAGNQGIAPSTAVGDSPLVSADGRFVAFESQATNLVADDANGWRDDIFVHDRVTGITELASVDSAGLQSLTGASFLTWMSPDGRYIGFTGSFPPSPGAHVSGSDVLIRDRLLGTTDNITTAPAWSDKNEGSHSLRASPDARYAVFTSFSSTLGPPDTNAREDVYLRDRETGATERISIGYAGEETDDASEAMAISEDGRYVLFWSLASNIVPDDNNGTADIFLRDRETQTTERLSVSNTGEGANDACGFANMTPDARFVAFTSGASNLVPGDTNGHAKLDMFLVNRRAITNLLSRGNTRNPQRDRAGCQVEWWVVNPKSALDRYKLPSKDQTCIDGDPMCDNDPAVGQCGFQITVCLNNRDLRLPVCPTSGVGEVTVVTPPSADLVGLNGALQHLEDPWHRENGYVNAAPLVPMQRNFCSAPFELKVPAIGPTGQPHRRTLRFKVRSQDTSSPPLRHLSQLRLTCRPSSLP